MYKITKSPTGRWVVRNGGNVIYSAPTKKQAQAYVDMISPK